MSKDAFYKMVLPTELTNILETTEFVIPTDTDELVKLSLGGELQDSYDVSYEVNGEMLREATVVNCKNGISINFDDVQMRRRDPDSMVIADDLPTDKTTYQERFGKSFADDRKATLDWLATQKLLVLPFFAGNRDLNIGYQALAVMPINASFFGTGIADLQCFIEKADLPEDFTPKAIIYIAPPFRHTLYDKRQIVVHNRKPNMHEVFAYNLYPGPSAKKGVYSILLNLGEKEGWNTLHASSVKITTPYELTLTIMHEGASGGGKSEMTEAFHRQEDGKLLLGTNIITGEATLLNMADNCELNPITDDMALAHPSLKSNNHKLVIADAEHGWFLRVDHIRKYGTEPLTERLCFHPHKPLVFFNMDGQPNATCLIWDHTEDAPGVPCPNPRVIMPRVGRECILDGAHEIDIRSFGVRTPPCTKEHPTYGIIGMFHVLPPALAWLWRLVAPRGHANPSIVDTSGGKMQSEGVGSYWPFATGRKVDQANLLLEQILNTLSTRYILIPNQYIGAYHTGFGAEWATREYLSRRGGCKFKREQLDEARCPLLGYVPDNIKMDGVPLPKGFFRVNRQLEVGVDAYDIGAKMLTDFFKEELKAFDSPELHPLGRKIIDACLNDAPVETYYNLIPKL